MRFHLPYTLVCWWDRFIFLLSFWFRRLNEWCGLYRTGQCSRSRIDLVKFFSVWFWLGRPPAWARQKSSPNVTANDSSVRFVCIRYRVFFSQCANRTIRFVCRIESRIKNWKSKPTDRYIREFRFLLFVYLRNVRNDIHSPLFLIVPMVVFATKQTEPQQSWMKTENLLLAKTIYR